MLNKEDSLKLNGTSNYHKKQHYNWKKKLFMMSFNIRKLSHDDCVTSTNKNISSKCM